MVNKCAADKENVPLALAAIHERPNTKQRLLQLKVSFQIKEMLPIFNTSWIISNSNKRFLPNILEML